MKYKIVKVEWCDARSVDIWCAIEEFEDKLATIHTAGYLIKENDDAIYISACLATGEGGEKDMGGCTIVIPRKMIIKLREIE